MWTTGVLGHWFTQFFFIVGLHFSLRGGKKHRDLVVEKFTRFPTDGFHSGKSYYEYVEHGSKKSSR